MTMKSAEPKGRKYLEKNGIVTTFLITGQQGAGKSTVALGLFIDLLKLGMKPKVIDENGPEDGEMKRIKNPTHYIICRNANCPLTITTQRRVKP